jgi:hypothetical protein
MQELYFVAFISFAALFFICEHLKPPASAFHDFKGVDREKNKLLQNKMLC